MGLRADVCEGLHGLRSPVSYFILITAERFDYGPKAVKIWNFVNNTVTVALSCIVSEIKRDIGVKVRIFLYKTPT